MKGQASAEFMIVLMLMVALLTVLSITSMIKTDEVSINNMQREAEDVLRNVGDKINTVYFEGDGFMTNVTIPDRILGFDYNISVNSKFIIIEAGHQTFSKVLFANVTNAGNFVKGTNNIKNVGGAIKINQ